MLVDLHVHLRGTLVRETVLFLAERNAVSIPEALLADARYGWHDFTTFLKAYDLVTSVVKSAADLELITTSYLKRCAELGGGYVEFMLSPPDLARTGVPFLDQLKALGAAADRAAEEWGVRSRLSGAARCSPRMRPFAPTQREAKLAIILLLSACFTQIAIVRLPGPTMASGLPVGAPCFGHERTGHPRNDLDLRDIELRQSVEELNLPIFAGARYASRWGPLEEPTNRPIESCSEEPKLTYVNPILAQFEFADLLCGHAGAEAERRRGDAGREPRFP
nr:hypothetical protein [Neoroseomonas marina]